MKTPFPGADKEIISIRIMSLMREMVFVLDAGKKITFINPATAETLGYDENELIGKNMGVFTHGTNDIENLLEQTIPEGSANEKESVLISKYGDRIEVLLTAEAADGSLGTSSAYIIIALDISEHKDLDRELRMGFDELSALNDILIISRRELERTNARLVELDKLKNNFISMISHELRTPLTAIKGFLRFLSGGVAGPLNPGQKEFADMINRNSERLLRLISDLLDMSKIESGTFSINMDKTDLTKIISSSIDDISSIAAARNIGLAKNFTDTERPAMIDSYRLSQVIINLVNNSLKFSPDNSIITVSIEQAGFYGIKYPPYVNTAGLNNCGYYVISIKDDGSGIPEGMHEKIFDRFFQVNQSSTSKPHGIGLGLPITREIINKHGGRIWAESVSGEKGSSFVFIIPSE